MLDYWNCSIRRIRLDPGTIVAWFLTPSLSRLSYAATAYIKLQNCKQFPWPCILIGFTRWNLCEDDGRSANRHFLDNRDEMSSFLSLITVDRISRAASPSQAEYSRSAGCKWNKSTFTDGCTRALGIENIRRFRQSQFIRRLQPPDSYIQFSLASADGRWRDVAAAFGENTVCSNDRFTLKFTGNFREHGLSRDLPGTYSLLLPLLPSPPPSRGIWKIYSTT